MVFASTGEEETHCKGAEVTIGDVLVSRNVDQISQVRLELHEGWREGGMGGREGEVGNTGTVKCVCVCVCMGV